MELFNSPAFSSRVEELLDEHHVPGIAIAIVRNETISSAGFGLASLRPPRKFSADTLLDIASASKSLTAASVGLLVEDDEKYPHIKYDTLMSRLLPEDFVMPGEGFTEGVTVEDILSHRTGMPGHDTSYLGPKARQPDDARSVTRNLRNLAVAAPLRAKYMYCNMMYTVATHLVEQETKLSFADFLDQNFFQPLCMNSTSLQPSHARARGLGDRITNAHHWDEVAQQYKVFDSPDAPEAQGAGSIVTSVNDYIKYVKAIMNQDRPFTKELYEGLIKARALPNPEFQNLRPYTSTDLYAAGWEVIYYRGYMIVLHDGSIPGIGTRHFFLPELRFGGVIFGNSDNVSIVISILANELIDEALKVPRNERLDWNAIERERRKAEDPNEAEEKVRQTLCPGIKDSKAQEIPLGSYTGDYQNPGYHRLCVEIKDGQLFVDATDRSFGFTLTFNHVCEQTKYVAHLRDCFINDDIPFRAEFVIQGGIAVRMGLHLEEDLEQYIWFDRISEKTAE